MGLNIKRKDTQKLAQQLARLTGENMSEAVTRAVRERLDRVRNQRGSSLSQRWVEIGQDSARRLKEPYRSISVDELLYDDRGLPK